MMVITIGREKTGTGITALHQLKSERLAIKRVAALQVCHPQMEMTPARSRERRRPAIRRGHEILDIEGAGEHRDFAVGKRPLLARTIGIELQTVAIRVGEVD